MHALGSLFNGYLLEILISKVLYLEKRIIDYASENQKKQRNQSRMTVEGEERNGLENGPNGGKMEINGSGNGPNGGKKGIENDNPERLFTPVRIQLIAMSATVGNVQELAQWFGRTVPFITDYRPVSLTENIVAGDECCNKDGNTTVEKLQLFDRSDYERYGRS